MGSTQTPSITLASVLLSVTVVCIIDYSTTPSVSVCDVYLYSFDTAVTCVITVIVVRQTNRCSVILPIVEWDWSVISVLYAFFSVLFVYVSKYPWLWFNGCCGYFRHSVFLATPNFVICVDMRILWMVSFAFSAADRWNIWKNCGFDETSMEFGPQVDYASMVIFRYRAISDSTCEKNGVHFQNGRHRLFEITRYCRLNQFQGWECFSFVL